MVATRRLVAVALLPTVLSCKSGETGLDLSKVDRSSGELPTLEIGKVAAPPTIDGKLDEAAWRGAGSTGPLVSPRDGKPLEASLVNAEGRLAWDDRALYVAVTVYDRDPQTPFSRDDVDPHIWSKASGVELMIQPGDRPDNRNYFEIQVDVAGAVWDTRFDDYNRPITGTKDNRVFGHQDWSAQLERAVAVAKGDHYVVEMAIPWSSFGLTPAPGEIWKLNLYTFRDGQRHALAWSPIMGQGNFHRSARFGRVRFAAGP